MTQALAAEVERRIEAALDSGANLDAKLVLLTLHAKVIQPSVVNDFGLESGAIEVGARRIIARVKWS